MANESPPAEAASGCPGREAHVRRMAGRGGLSADGGGRLSRPAQHWRPESKKLFCPLYIAKLPSVYFPRLLTPPSGKSCRKISKSRTNPTGRGRIFGQSYRGGKIPAGFRTLSLGGPMAIFGGFRRFAADRLRRSGRDLVRWKERQTGYKRARFGPATDPAARHTTKQLLKNW